MKTPCLCLLSALLASTAASALAAPDGFIWLNVSIKVIVNPATGSVPATMNDALLRESFVDMNRWLANTWRGYRVRAVDLDASQNFRRIGGEFDPTGPSKWYSTNLKSDAAANLMFETEAKANKPLYGWNDSAINIYFNNGGNGNGFSSAQSPVGGRELVQSAYGLFKTDLGPGEVFAPSYKVAGNLLHEIGHYFGLCHTFCRPDDGIADTARDPLDPDAISPDEADDTRNEAEVRHVIARYHFSRNYSALTTAEKALVDNTANNAMSYYQLFYDDPPQNKVLTEAERFGPARFLFTERQIDRWADCANGACAATASGRMIFVGGPLHVIEFGTSEFPFKTLAHGINAAGSSGRDIVLLRPGNYNEPMTLTKPLTLRATRQGKAAIGLP